MTPRLLLQYHDQLTTAWQSVRADITQRLSQTYPELTPLAPTLDDFLARPGKFVRPSLLLFGYQWSNTTITEHEVSLAISLEVLHTYLLIHDDLMDRSDRRRGGPSLHVRLANDHRAQGRYGDAAHYGLSTAILIGDLLAGYAESLWTTVISQTAIVPGIRHSFDQLKEEVYAGQFFDLDLGTRPALVTLDDILHLARLKTARYSVYWPLQIGNALAGQAEPEWLAPLAETTGTLYQIIDDLLSSFGQPKTTGKSIDADIDERKLTFLVALARDRLTGNNAHEFNEYLSDRGAVRPETAARIRTLFEKSGARSAAQELAEQFAEGAQTIIRASDLAPIHQQQFAEFIVFLLNRDH